MMRNDLISKTVENMPFSGIRKFFDVASEVEGVISLGVGEPDFDTPWNIREEAIYNLEKGKTIYTSNTGLPALRQEISRYLNRRFNIKYNPADQIIVTVGASEGIDIALRAIINPGDEVLLIEPCYVSYRPCIMMAGGVPVTINTKVENEFRVTPEEILEKITDKTKALLISYPNNPTGAIMERENLAKIVEVLKDKEIVVISDEIYGELTYGDREHVSIASFPEMYDKTIVLNGFSKAYAMTGWRLGYAAGPKEIISAMLKIHQYVIMCAPTTAQYAGVEALKNGDESVARMKDDYDTRRRTIVNGFREMGLDVFEPLGAFYVFPCIKSTGLTTDEFCNRILFEEKVAVVPGSAFGECGEGFIRCSYAYSIENIKAALERIEKFVRKVRG